VRLFPHPHLFYSELIERPNYLVYVNTLLSVEGFISRRLILIISDFIALEEITASQDSCLLSPPQFCWFWDLDPLHIFVSDPSKFTAYSHSAEPAVMVVGALIFVLGIDLVKEALWDTRHRVSRYVGYLQMGSILTFKDRNI